MSRFHRRRFAVAATTVVTASLVLAGCGSGSSTPAASIASAPPSKLTGTVSLWHFFTDREAGVIQQAVNGFEKKYPGVKVEIHSGQDDEKLQKAISSGQPIDVGLSYSTSIVGSFCSSGAFKDLGAYIKRDKVNLDDLSTAPRDYTEFQGTRCTMPVLADTSALMFNKKDLAAAGISAPPKTLDELKTDALKMTTYNSDGSIKTLGFDPLIGFYENSPEHFAPMVAGQWLDKNGKSLIGTSAGWKKLIQWQKSFVDAIGYDKLKAYTAGLGQEFSADNAFQKGKVAMEIDGEYRTAFIEDQAKTLDYGTAPTPVMPGYGTYGASSITGNVAGIAKGSKNPELAWALLKYLSLDTDAQVVMGNGLKNVPTITSALQSPKLEVDANYKTFVDAALNPKTQSTPASTDGAAYITTFSQMWQDYQAHGGDLDAKLKSLDTNIDNSNALSGP